MMYSLAYVSQRDGLDDSIAYLIPTIGFRGVLVCVCVGVCEWVCVQPNPTEFMDKMNIGFKEKRRIVENVF